MWILYYTGYSESNSFRCARRQFRHQTKFNSEICLCDNFYALQLARDHWCSCNVSGQPEVLFFYKKNYYLYKDGWICMFSIIVFVKIMCNDAYPIYAILCNFLSLFPLFSMHISWRTWLANIWRKNLMWKWRISCIICKVELTLDRTFMYEFRNEFYLDYIYQQYF